jgi:ribosomal protein L7Ae-like RNA K-turn-binding protein
LTEAVIKKFKALCLEMRIPYRYVDLPTALKEASGLCGEMHY